MICRRKMMLGGLAFMAAMTGTSAFARSSRPASFEAMDRDRDGTLDIDEVKRAAAAKFDELDTEHLGVVRTAKLRRRLSRSELAAHKGEISKNDYLAIVQKRFDAADADHDGTLSRAEFRSLAGLALRRLLH